MSPSLSISMLGIVKSFAGVKAVQGAELSVEAGSIHGLLGQNGAGKTTLMNILAGIYKAEAGRILINQEPVSIRAPRDARRAGIGMVHQHFRLIPTFTVAENLAMVRSPLVFGPKTLGRDAAAWLDRIGLGVSPSAPVSQLSVGQAQKIEIAKALMGGARVLILDEPTAVLTPEEIDELFHLLRKMCREGLTVIFITHKLGEVLRFTDQVTVMRLGRTVESMPTQRAQMEGLAQLMFGGAWDKWEEARTVGPEEEDGPEMLRLQGVSLPSQGVVQGLHGVDLSVRAGSITGIAGVSGNGQESLAELLIGLRRPTGGRCYLGGVEVTRPSPAGFIAWGVAYVPGDRLGQGLCPGLGAGDNVALKRHARPPFSRRGIYRPRAVRDFTFRIIRRYGIKLANLDSPVSLLSGGNLQRLILGRELDRRVRLLVAVNPSRGLDIEGMALMRAKLRQLRKDGVGIVLISEDLEELQALSDHLHVIHGGRLSPALPRGSRHTARLGQLMAGVGMGEV